MDNKIFTDGACKGNPGPGGWGAIVVLGEVVTELGGREANTTNNQMELQAAIAALNFALSQKAKDIVVYTDSSYVINGISKWMVAWKKKGWKTSTGQAVMNVELWQRLDEYNQAFGKEIVWEYVGGHIGVAGNERCDEIASALAEGKNVDLYSGPLSRYRVDVSNVNFDLGLRKEKSSARSRSKLSAYSYVSEVNGKVRTHRTWAECEALVKGKKAHYKKATSAAEEKQIIAEFSK